MMCCVVIVGVLYFIVFVTGFFVCVFLFVVTLFLASFIVACNCAELTSVNTAALQQSLEKDLKQHSSHLDSFSTLATQLCQVCEPPVQAEVQSTVSDIRTKWNKLSADLSTRRAQFERCLSKWREYEREYEKISDWLSQKEAECNELVAMREDVSARQECLEKSQVRGKESVCVCV